MTIKALDQSPNIKIIPFHIIYKFKVRRVHVRSVRYAGCTSARKVQVQCMESALLCEECTKNVRRVQQIMPSPIIL